MEREALAEIVVHQKSGTIVIQPADKVSGICILDRKDYVDEAQRQLNANLVFDDQEPKKYYKKVDQESIQQQYDEIKRTLEEGVKKNYFTKTFAKQMLPPKPKSGSFYLLPKVHKEFENIPKVRPIIPGCGSNTERILWFCDQGLKEKVKETLPIQSKPVSIDLKSMYTNIPIQEGLDAFREELEKSLRIEMIKPFQQTFISNYSS